MNLNPHSLEIDRSYKLYYVSSSVYLVEITQIIFRQLRLVKVLIFLFMFMSDSIRMFKTIVGLAIFTLVLSCQSGTRNLAQAPLPRTLKILALGDSLTAGVANNGGYRPHLYVLLRDAGFSVDFLGSIQQGPPDMPDPDHEGYGGYRIDQLDTVVEKSLGKFKPDFILLGAGGNDIAQKL